MSEHIHHEHTHDHAERAFPADAENLLLDLAVAAKNGRLTLPDGWSTDDTSNRNHVLDLHNTYDIGGIKARLEKRDNDEDNSSFPALDFAEYSAMVLAFEREYSNLPTTHPGFEHAHHEGDDHHDCGKIHGPLRRQFDKFERKVLGKISNRRAHALATAAFRLSALTVCPGDDLAAIGMQAYGAISGQTSDGERHQELAVLPRRPRIDFANNKMYLPLDVGATHTEMPKTETGMQAREVINDVEPMQRAVTTERLAREAAVKPERRRRRRRIMAVGAMALAALGVGLGDTMQTSDPTNVVSATEKTSVTPVQPETERPIKPEHRPEVVKKPDHVVQHTVERGDSQWEITQEKVEQATGTANPAVINAATSYMTYVNRASHPTADSIDAGDRMLVASPDTIKRIHDAVTQPERADPVLVRYINILNSQVDRASDVSQRTLKLLNGYLHR